MTESSTKAEVGLEKGGASHHEHFYDEEHYHTLGHVRLRDATTNEIILIPAPSLDPNDPLKWLVHNFIMKCLYVVVFLTLSYY
jgi:hypothetical protein